MRKIIVIFLIITAVVASAASVWVLLRQTENKQIHSLFDAIQPNSALIVDIRNYKELCKSLPDNAVWQQLIELTEITSLNDVIMLLDSIFQTHEQIASTRANIIFSVHPSEKNELQAIGYVHVNNDREATAISRNLQRHNFHCAYRNRIFVFSRSSELAESAVRHITTGNKITQNENLLRLISSAGKNSPANIYVNFNYLPQTALSLFNPKHIDIYNQLRRFADWAELDLNLRTDMLLFNGFTEFDKNKNQWFENFVDQPAIPITLVDAMPSTTSTFLWMGIRKLELFFSAQNKHLEENKVDEQNIDINRIGLQQDMIELFEEELALVYANVGQSQWQNEPFVVFRVKNSSSAANMVENWQITGFSTISAEAEKRTLNIDDNQIFSAYNMPFDLPGTLFGKIFANKNQWCAVADNYLVFSSSHTNLQRYLQYTKSHANLQTNVEYGRLSNLISARSNLMFYSNPARMGIMLENILKPDNYEETKQTIANMQTIVYQLDNTDGKLYNNLLIRGTGGTTGTGGIATSEADEGIIRVTGITSDDFTTTTAVSSTVTGMQTSWETLLDTAIIYKPQLVRNHNTGETEIFVQDMANNIYLLNNIGRILWKVKLPETIISPVFQVDLYQNGKLQMLFNTKNFIYVVDRLGNFVNRFPIRLSSPATGSVAVFDYDNNRQYRIMIACEDRRVYLFDRTGRAVDGWTFRQADYPVHTDLYHFRTGNRDYVVFADNSRVYILDRQGRTRATPEYNLPVARHTTIALDRQRSRILLTDTLGTIHFISLSDGKITQQRIKNMPSSHYFVYHDIDSDGQGDFIFAYNNRLEVFRHDARQIIDIEMREPINFQPNIYEFAANDRRIGIVQSQSNQIWLFDSNGRASQGFPLRGNTAFTIGRLDRASSNFNLFVGSQNNFLYNYSVRR